jgi:glyoxylase-like metal-dependent hydrolase (beta-lactamase superfamily II)
MILTRRRLFLGAAAVAAAGVAQTDLAATLADAATSVDAFVKGPPVADRPLVQISPHVHMIQAPDGFPTPENQGLMSNLTFVIGRDGVVVVDSGASVQIAEMAIRGLEKVTAKPVIGIVNTHYHGDHWLGNDGFVARYGADLPIWAHAGTRRAIEGATGTFWHDAMLKWTAEATLGTRIVPPNRDIDHGFEVSLGDVTLRMHHHGVAHTPSDICVEVIGDGVMCMGDVLMDHRIANMDDGSYRGTFATLDAIVAATRTTIWHPAHGTPGPGVLAWHRSLFEGIWDSCVAAVEKGIPLDGALAAAMADPRVSSQAAVTRGFERNIGKYVSLAYLEAEQAQF